MKRTHTYEADDGTTFETAAECKLYEERASLIDILSDLPILKVQAAFDGTNVRLADAIERAGKIIAAKRRGKKTDPFGYIKAMAGGVVSHKKESPPETKP